MCGHAQSPRSQLENRQQMNKLFGALIPLILVCVIGYATWVVIAILCANYLIRDDHGRGAGIAIIVIYFILLLPMAVSWFRVVIIIFTNPGYTALGPPNDCVAGAHVKFIPDVPTPAAQMFSKKKKEEANTAKNESSQQKPESAGLGQWITHLDYDGIFRGDTPAPEGTERFWSNDVFQCDPHGLPIWCGACNNWKSDRVHHCSDIGRCVLKMDHFCPWIGGVVGEVNIKFFYQFCFYAAVYTLFLLIVMAVYVARWNTTHSATRFYYNNWAATLGLAAVFFVFTGGMTVSNVQHLYNNMTTVDAIDAARRIVYLAIRIRDTDRSPAIVEQPDSESHKYHKSGERKNPFAPRQHGNFDSGGPIPWEGTITYPLYNKGNSTPGRKPITFAIVKTPPGMNPWNLGFSNNVRSMMGPNVLDWFLPLHIVRDRGHGSIYPMGSDFEELKRRAGIELQTGLEDHRPVQQDV
ncbi:hypothetical protein MBLNU457_4116t1 [Dothideomycetes sp. NU457]